MGGRARTFLGGGDMDLVLTGHGSKKAQEFFDKDSTYSREEKECCVGCGWGEVGVHCDRTKCEQESKGKYSEKMSP